MPVRSSTTRVFRWPDRAAVEAALRDWAAREGARRPGLRRVGYFGSYARGDWGVGSDLDVVVVVDEDPRPLPGRARDWDPRPLPVHADVLVYTEAELAELVGSGRRFGRMLNDEAVWVYDRARLANA